jgi:pectinesterase
MVAAGRRRRRCAAAILLVLPVVAVLASSSAAADGSFITWDDLSTPSAAAVQGGVKAASGGGARELDTIVVAQDGTGHSRTVQGAVDMVPAGNSRRVKILVRPGVYRCVASRWLPACLADRPPRRAACYALSTTRPPSSLLLYW